jgi:hypothetical protein
MDTIRVCLKSEKICVNVLLNFREKDLARVGSEVHYSLNGCWIWGEVVTLCGG